MTEKNEGSRALISFLYPNRSLILVYSKPAKIYEKE